MEQRHKYEYKVNPEANSAAAKVVRQVGSNKRVLEIGAGPGSITRLLKDRGGCRVTAIELDAEAIEKLTPFCERIYQCDLNDANWPSIVSDGGKFQVVVAADVLEHLSSPATILQAIKTLLDRDGYMVISLPHVGYNGVIACMVEGDFAYGNWGLLDKTHVWFFGIKNIQQLFDEAGFAILDAEFVVLPPERTEFADFWRRLPAKIKLSLSGNRYGTVYQVVIKAKPAEFGEHGLTLDSIPIPSTRCLNRYAGMTFYGAVIEFLKSLVRPHMSLESQEKLGNFLRKIGIRY
jgi:2-polyprenyl-3-methyl-5-hydroxy-6-metoxy-1,4-benzoquinol methylase